MAGESWHFLPHPHLRDTPGSSVAVKIGFQFDRGPLTLAAFRMEHLVNAESPETPERAESVAPPATPVNLILMVGESAWPAIQAFVHWHRHVEAGLRRIGIYPAADSRSGTRGGADRVAHWIRQEAPTLRVEIAEGGTAPGVVRARLEAWIQEDPEGSWVIDLSGAGPWSAWAAESLTGRPNLSLVQRQAPGDWVEWNRNEAGQAVTRAFPGVGRDQTDDLTVLRLARSFAANPNREGGFNAQAVSPLPLVPLTEAARVRDWRWAEAFLAAGADQPAGSIGQLFERYVAALVASLGIKNAIHLRRSRSRAEGAGEPDSQVWINLGGRLWVLDISLVGEGDRSETPDATATEPQGKSLVRREIERAAAERRSWAGLEPEWLLVRPCLGLTGDQLALVQAEGLRVVDESGGCGLPSRLAEWLGVPLSAEGAEVERVLRAHLAATGRVRVFGQEPASVQRLLASGSDPIVVNVDALVESIREERRQNWLLWTSRGRVFLRLPTDGRPSAATDWGFLVAGIGGLELGQVQAVDPKPAGRSVVLEFPDQGAARTQVRDWLRPFLNASVSFAAAQERFFALARISQESGGVPAPAALPASSATASSPPRKPHETRRPTPPPRTAPPAAPRVKNPLADLDRALDDAFGG